jgi:hypothetical protein
VSRGGDSPKDPANALPTAFFIQDQVSVSKGKDKIQSFVVISGSKTRRFYCQDCNSLLAMAPAGFPMVGLHTQTLKRDTAWPALEMRHSLEHVKQNHDATVAACKSAGDNVPWQEKQYAPCCQFLCPVICAKTCCCCCKGTKVPELTGVDHKSITEIACEGTSCDDSTKIKAAAPGAVTMDRA